MTTSRSDHAQDAALERTSPEASAVPIEDGPRSPGHEERMMRQLLSRFADGPGEGRLPEGMPNLAEIRRQLTEFQLHYKFGMDEVLTKINILREEFEHTRDYSPIEHVNYRLKSLERILDKVQRYGIQPDLTVVRDRIRDIAGIRITCSFVSDSYWIAEMLCSQPDLRVIEVKDYISRPKPNGYRSLHVILQVPVFLSNRTEFVYVEVQIRTVAMDFWASLEHKIYYTYSGEVPDDIVADLHDAAQRVQALDRQMADIRDRVTSLKEQAPRPGEGATGAAPPAENRPDGGRWFPGAPAEPEERDRPETD